MHVIRAVIFIIAALTTMTATADAHVAVCVGSYRIFHPPSSREMRIGLTGWDDKDNTYFLTIKQHRLQARFLQIMSSYGATLHSYGTDTFKKKGPIIDVAFAQQGYFNMVQTNGKHSYLATITDVGDLNDLCTILPHATTR